MNEEELIDKIAHIIHGARCCDLQTLSYEVNTAHTLMDEVIIPLRRSTQVETLRATAEEATNGIIGDPTLLTMVHTDPNASTVFRYFLNIMYHTADILERGTTT